MAAVVFATASTIGVVLRRQHIEQGDRIKVPRCTRLECAAMSLDDDVIVGIVGGEP